MSGHTRVLSLLENSKADRHIVKRLTDGRIVVDLGGSRWAIGDTITEAIAEIERRELISPSPSQPPH
jgi:hypothetical protein